MSTLSEIAKIQKKVSLLHKKEILWYKILLVIITLLSGILPVNIKIYFSLSLIIFSLITLIFLDALKIITRLFILYLSLAAVVTPFSLLGGASPYYLLALNLYTISTFMILTLFVVTTPWNQIEEVLGDNIIVYAYRMLDLSLRDVQRVIDSYIARGAEISPLKPWKAIPFFITILYITTLVRIPTLEESLKSRGLEV
jgi:hypothetical protein